MKVLPSVWERTASHGIVFVLKIEPNHSSIRPLGWHSRRSRYLRHEPGGDILYCCRSIHFDRLLSSDRVRDRCLVALVVTTGVAESIL